MTKANDKGAVIVTGASSGIGLAIALRLAKRGYHVIAGVRRAEAERELSRLGQPRLQPVLFDVAEPASIEHAMTRVRVLVKDGLPLRALINNAAICVTAPLELVQLSLLEQQFAVNVVGVAAMTQAALPLLLASRGRIINIGSNVGRVAPPFLGPYAASKAALEALTDCWRRELSSSGVFVSLVVPGAIMTPVWEKIAAYSHEALAGSTDALRRRYEQPLRRFVEMNHATAQGSRLLPDDVAKLIESSLADKHPSHRYEVGLGASAGTWISRLLPASWVDAGFRRALRVH